MPPSQRLDQVHDTMSASINWTKSFCPSLLHSISLQGANAVNDMGRRSTGQQEQEELSLSLSTEFKVFNVSLHTWPMQSRCDLCDLLTL
ncbi:hypothetical protein AVEN_19691-1 [Araneus ventricosus]|uniref:Uncharacterized protein n=1 Tax=Araneus ventricosus TaxID=182803 RepID=A0A4Y2C5Q7_ARAVE|nr:hypothetical protein AVEN_19691-1 [Araneus ventricosus]